MVNSLTDRARRLLPAQVVASAWERLRFHWLTCDGNPVGFLLVLPLPLVIVGAMAWFAYADQMRIAAERQRRADLTCLAENVYYEARGEPLAGQYAVAEVTLNRVASPRFPATVCEVVHESRWDPIRRRQVGAFSWTEFDSMPPPDGLAWERAITVAGAVYDNREGPLVDGALFYHAAHIVPAWARTKRRIAMIGRHHFYE